MKIKTTKDLYAAFPGLCDELVRRASAQAHEDEKTKAAESERRRILSLAIIHFGRPAAERFSRAVKALDAPAPPKKNKEKNMTSFMERVGVYQLEKNCSRTEAIHAVVEKHPDLHAEYIAQAQTQTEKSDSPGPGSKTFEAEVRAFRKKHSCSTAESIKAVSGLYPSLHKQYIARLESGDVESLV